MNEKRMIDWEIVFDFCWAHLISYKANTNLTFYKCKCSDWNRHISKRITTECQFWQLLHLLSVPCHDLCLGPALGLLTSVKRISMLISLFQIVKKDKNIVLLWAGRNNEQENKEEEWDRIVHKEKGVKISGGMNGGSKIFIIFPLFLLRTLSAFLKQPTLEHDRRRRVRARWR